MVISEKFRAQSPKWPRPFREVVPFRQRILYFCFVRFWKLIIMKPNFVQVWFNMLLSGACKKMTSNNWKILDPNIWFVPNLMWYFVCKNCIKYRGHYLKFGSQLNICTTGALGSQNDRPPLSTSMRLLVHKLDADMATTIEIFDIVLSGSRHSFCVFSNTASSQPTVTSCGDTKTRNTFVFSPVFFLVFSYFF